MTLPTITGSPPGPVSRLEIPREKLHGIAGAAFIAVLIIAAAVGGYYFLVYKPYMEHLEKLKAEKLAEVNKYFTGPLANDPVKFKLIQMIMSAQTPEQVQSIDVKGIATIEWKKYWIGQIKFNQKRGIVELITPQGPQLLSVKDAINKVKSMNLKELMKITVKKPETVLVAIKVRADKAPMPLFRGEKVTLVIYGVKKIYATPKPGAGATSASHKVVGIKYKWIKVVKGCVIRYIFLTNVNNWLNLTTTVKMISASALVNIYKSGSVNAGVNWVLLVNSALGGAKGGGAGAAGRLPGTTQITGTTSTGAKYREVAYVTDLRDFIKLLALEQAKKKGGFIRALNQLEAKEGIRGWKFVVLVIEIPSDLLKDKKIVKSLIYGWVLVTPEMK
ncbi:MAG: DUF515 domain-containing protein [Methanopyri archaeon]|nr:DUF515 domain-containing protein [Methanopyri archaeon]